MATLLYYSTTGKWCEYTLKPRTTIGRLPTQDLQLLDRMVSKEHAEIRQEADGSYTLHDLNSRNGTLLNGKQITEPVRLWDGDEIELGSHILRYVEQEAGTVSSSALKISRDISHDSRASGAGLSAVNRLSADAGFNRDSLSIRQRIEDSHFLPENEISSMADLRRDYEKLRVAAELSAEAVGVFDLNTLLQLILDKAFAIFNADRGAILLRDEETDTMTVKLALTRDKRPLHNYKISETLLEEVIHEKNAVLSRDALQDNRFSSSHSIVCDNIRSTMCVPLMYEGEVKGLINLDTQIATGAFKEKDLQILTGFARQASLNIQRNRLINAMKRQAIVQDNLRRIIPPHLINDVLNGKIKLEKSGSRHNATVLFADIRGFTRMSEENPPEEIVALVNDYCERMVECIFNHEGSLDKFVGDQVMAVWGAGVRVEDHALRAVQCAIDMMSAIDKLNDEREAVGKPRIAIGIGISSGIMIAGYMGSTQAMSYTVLGDTVNLGARLCSSAQPGEILINRETWESVRDETSCTPLPPMMVKGKTAPLDIYRVAAKSTSACEDAYEQYRSSVLPCQTLAKDGL